MDSARRQVMARGFGPWSAALQQLRRPAAADRSKPTVHIGGLRRGRKKEKKKTNYRRRLEAGGRSSDERKPCCRGKAAAPPYDVACGNRQRHCTLVVCGWLDDCASVEMAAAPDSGPGVQVK